MNIKVLFFAQLKDAFGTGERTAEVRQGTTVGEFARSLFKEPNVSRLRELSVRYSVNEEFVDENRKLHENDTLALLPPVAGG